MKSRDVKNILFLSVDDNKNMKRTAKTAFPNITFTDFLTAVYPKFYKYISERSSKDIAGKIKELNLTSYIGNNQKIVLDIHGWLNQTYGDYEVAQYFDNQFGFGHSSSWGSGYLETWAKSIGAKASLIELPMPTSSTDIINRDFSGKLTNGIINMLGGSGASEGGTEVNEQVVVNVSGNLNVRSGAGTGYSLVTTLSNGTIVTRIKSGVATANGYVWDKIRLDNGTEGYVATNYLSIANSSSNLDTYTFENLLFSTDSNLDYSITLKTEGNIIEGEETYNSVSISESERATEEAKKQLGINLASLAYGAQMKDAANNLVYFLTSGEYVYQEQTGTIYAYESGYYKQGHTAKEMLFENAISDVTEAKNTLNTGINAMIDASENMLVDNNTSEIINCYTEINAQCPAQNLDWFLGVYNYRTRNTARVIKNGNTFTMTLKHTVIDYYDWEETEGILNWNPYIGSQTEFSHLNKYGLSRNYTNYDVLYYTVSWTNGQRVGTGASVEGTGV